MTRAAMRRADVWPATTWTAAAAMRRAVSPAAAVASTTFARLRVGDTGCEQDDCCGARDHAKEFDHGHLPPASHRQKSTLQSGLRSRFVRRIV
jgi:hypothetical protein